MKKIPQRKCMACNTLKFKNELIRIVKNKEGQINIDKTGKLSGRGAYICDSTTCLEKLIKSKKLQRTFEQEIKEDIYNELREVISTDG